MRNILLIGLVIFGGLAVQVNAQDPCSRFYGNGYCTDYVKNRLGTKPSGNAGSWNPNVNPRNVRPGDVVIFTKPGRTGHVAIIERVIYEHNTATPYELDISEWNWGGTSSNALEKQCVVTQKFGKRGTRTIRVNRPDIKGYWRP